MNQETKTCQNCKNQFVIEPEDFEFYEKIQVPPPTFCPECRLQRRSAFCNHFKLYKRKDDFTGKDIISLYPEGRPFPVYHYKIWWSDKWDPMAYAKEYDFSKPFFEQFHDLINKVPRYATFNKDTVNCEYCPSISNSKNCYLVAGNYCDDSAYILAHGCVRCFDGYFILHNENCYECVDCDDNYTLFYGQNADHCVDSAFIYNSRNLQNCFGCVNLRNKKYNIFNKQYSKEDYFRLLKTAYDLGSYQNLSRIKNQFENFKLKFPRKFAHLHQSVNVIGDNVSNARNCFYCFDIRLGAEDSKHVLIGGMNLKNSYDVYDVGTNAQLLYETIYAGMNAHKVFFSNFVSEDYNVAYSDNCYNCHDLFACVGLRNKSYCILNKQYTKEEYEELVPKIIKHMNDLPYIDKKGRVYKYGEFFPPELSPFSYNETIAQEYFPLSAEAAAKAGYNWKDPEPRAHQMTIQPENLPDHIKDVKDDILNQTIECAHQGTCNEQCTTAFRIIPQELEFYRKMNLPLPRLCPNCRHYQRLKQRNPLKLWHRKCQCSGEKSENGVYTNTASHSQHSKTRSCPSEFQTTYAPERSEIVYCESCYNNEVA